MKNWIFIIILLVISLPVFSQETETDTIPKKVWEFGANVSSLAYQVLPFSEQATLIGPYTLGIKRSFNNFTLRYHIGANLGDFLNQAYFNSGIGFELGRKLHKNWSVTYGLDGIISFGSLNYPGVDFGHSGRLGISLFGGLRYNFNNSLYITTETSVFFSQITTEAQIAVLPPIGIFLFYRID